MGRQAGFARGDVAKQLGQHALGQVIGFDLVIDGERAEFGNQAPVAADDAFEKTRYREMVQTAVFAITLASAEYQGQVARLASPVEMCLECYGQVLRKSDADESAGGQRLTRLNQRRRRGRANQLGMRG